MTFRTVVGHRGVKGLLSAAIARASVPPTLLLVGPVGVGKRLVASATAATINCTAPLRDGDGLAIDACGRCRSCDRIARDVHVDVLVIEPDDSALIKIDVIRDVLDRTSFRPFEGRKRVVVLRDADAMQGAAQNALLKSLEEPPSSTIFMLTTAVPGVLLPTVRSRCMRLRLGRLTQAEVAEVLARDHGRSPADARAAAALADGSVSAALDLSATDLNVLRDIGVQLLTRAASGAAAARLQAATPIATLGPKRDRERREVKLALRQLASMLRDIELLNAGADDALLANAGLADQLRGLARRYGGDRARTAFAAVDRAVAVLERNAGTKVVVDWVALQL
jgi:DNA polymerase-3 subunit delta'